MFDISTSLDNSTPKLKWTIFPVVVASGKYREYYTNEMNKKLHPKKKKIVKWFINESYSDLDIIIHYQEDDDMLRDGKYVLTKYEEKYYPGEKFNITSSKFLKHCNFHTTKNKFNFTSYNCLLFRNSFEEGFITCWSLFNDKCWSRFMEMTS